MEWLEQSWQQISQYVDVMYLFTFMLIAYGVKRYLGDFLNKITNLRWKTVYTVLIIATLVGVPFFFFNKDHWPQILFTYTLGTSLHELIFQWLEDKFFPKKL